ncbi:MAG: MXAN_2562 family outer membrane beta-barrel protein [Myxococcota bacterium]
MSRPVRTLLLASLLASAATPALAAEIPREFAESPRHMMLELHVGPYQPQVDDQFDSASPYQDTFGDDQMILFGMHLDYQIWQEVGSVAVGGGIRYGWVDGQALDANGEPTDDDTSLNLMPLEASAVYRFDYAAIRWGVPLVPYAKAGLTYAIWWVKDGRDEVANARDPDGGGRVGRGGTFGFHAKAGLQILLDWASPDMATEFDQEVGVNNSYLFAEYSWNSINNFGSDTSIDLSDATASFGLMFEF